MSVKIIQSYTKYAKKHLISVNEVLAASNRWIAQLQLDATFLATLQHSIDTKQVLSTAIK